MTIIVEITNGIIVRVSCLRAIGISELDKVKYVNVSVAIKVAFSDSFSSCRNLYQPDIGIASAVRACLASYYVAIV